MSDDLTTKLYFGPWYRRSPYFEATLAAGCKAYDIYNKMYLPAEYDDVANEYRALNEGVTLWDVGVERTVQISGPDADRLTDMLTCRDLTKCAVNQGKYMLVIAPHGGIVNDPVLLHPEGERLVDAARRQRRRPVRARRRLAGRARRRGHLPGRPPGAGAGPEVGPDAREAGRPGHLRHQVLLDARASRSATSRSSSAAPAGRRVPGFEVNLLDGSRGTELWNLLMDAGEEYEIRPIAPNEARRVEAGIFNWGSDITLADTPFHVMGLERLVEEQPQDYIGKDVLERIRREGVDRKLVGLWFDESEPLPGITRKWDAEHDGRPVGPVTDAVWSPGLERNIGYVWVPIELAGEGNHIDVHSEHGPMSGVTHSIPFVDPRKERPAAALSRAS